MGLPVITFEGNLTAEPELRFTPSGAPVVNFTVVESDRKKNQQTEEWEDRDTTFVRVNAWRELAENVAESLHKGFSVIVVGKLKQRSWEDPEGNKRSSFEIDAYNVAPSLKRATATVAKVKRDSSPVREDPWGGGTPVDGPQQASDVWAAKASPAEEIPF